MGFRFQRRLDLGGGFRLNLSKSGPGLSWGIPGFRIGRSARGSQTMSVGMPGTGLSYRTEQPMAVRHRGDTDGSKEGQGSRGTRLYGIANDTAAATFRSLDPSRFMVYFIDETDPEHRTVEQLNMLSRQAKHAFSDERRVVGVMTGSYSYCQHYLNNLSDLFEAVFVAGDSDLLGRLGVKIVDQGWTEGARRISLDEIMDV